MAATSQRPRIRGSAISSAVEDVARLLQSGALPAEEIEARLTAEDLALVEGKVEPGLWYPVDGFARLLELLLERRGHGNPAYLVERGRRAAQRIADSGLYAQLDTSMEAWGHRIGKILITLGPAMFSDTRWSYEAADDVRRFRVGLEIPGDFPDICRHPIQGFIDHLAQRFADAPMRVTSARVSSTRIELSGELR